MQKIVKNQRFLQETFSFKNAPTIRSPVKLASSPVQQTSPNQQSISSQLPPINNYNPALSSNKFYKVPDVQKLHL